jgi:hypothetical protein
VQKQKQTHAKPPSRKGAKSNLKMLPDDSQEIGPRARRTFKFDKESTRREIPCRDIDKFGGITGLSYTDRKHISVPMIHRQKPLVEIFFQPLDDVGNRFVLHLGDFAPWREILFVARVSRIVRRVHQLFYLRRRRQLYLKQPRRAVRIFVQLLRQRREHLIHRRHLA